MKKPVLPSQAITDQNPKKAIAMASRVLAETPPADHLQMVRCLSIIGNCLKDTNNNIEATVILKRGLQEAIKSKSLRAEAILLNALGTTLANSGQTKEAQQCYRKCKLLALSLGDSEISGAVSMHLAIQHIQSGEYKEGLLQLLELLFLEDYSTVIEHRSFVYANISFLYQAINDFENALAYKLKAAEVLPDKHPSVSRAVIASGLGMSYLGVGDIANALPYFYEELSIAKALGLRTHKAMALHGIGQVYEIQGLRERSVKSQQEALSLFKESGYLLGEFHSSYSLALHYHRIDDHKAAIPYLRGCIAIATKASWLGIIGPLYKEIAQLFDAAMNTKEANACYRKYIEFEEQFNTFKSRNELMEIHRRFEPTANPSDQSGNSPPSSAVPNSLESLIYTVEQQRSILEKIQQQLPSYPDSTTEKHRLSETISKLLDQSTQWKFIETHLSPEEAGFSKKLLTTYPKLTRTELKICQFLKLGWSTKAISNFLCISPLTVDKHRTSIRTKLCIPSGISAQAFLLTL